MLSETILSGCIGVASYGALGHVPPRLPTNNFFLVHFGAIQSITAICILLRQISSGFCLGHSCYN